MEQPVAFSSHDWPTDKEFYWRSSPIKFLVGGVLFKVPSQRFRRGSSHFFKQYAQPISRPEGGMRAVLPMDLPLPDVSVEDFRCFLKVLYPSHLQPRTKLSKDGWLSVLRLSTKWVFKDIRKLAISRLDASNLTPTEMVCLGKEYYISRWVLAGYDNLVRNMDGLIPYEDAEQIGYKTTVMLYMCREKRLYDTNPQYLQDAFEDQLDELAKEEEIYLPKGAMADAVDDMGMDESEGEEAPADSARKSQGGHKEQLKALRAESDQLSDQLDMRCGEVEELKACIHSLQKTLHRTEVERDKALHEHLVSTTELTRALSEAQASIQKEKEERADMLTRYQHLEANHRQAAYPSTTDEDGRDVAGGDRPPRPFATSFRAVPHPSACAGSTPRLAADPNGSDDDAGESSGTSRRPFESNAALPSSLIESPPPQAGPMPFLFVRGSPIGMSSPKRPHDPLHQAATDSPNPSKRRKTQGKPAVLKNPFLNGLLNPRTQGSGRR
ncbi:hypothetical protein BKA70DRAFT_1574432 [Coprinopsis sp. MPI-PUGE-AT-0042]|nr:hypothetical protein BKA70DRAFT_1574432 [Coprinopsis sp. MPI-PUGE-AT-0042]